MANEIKYTSVNFGSGSAGASAGFTLYNTDGTLKQARITDGVVELGSSGCFVASFRVATDWQGYVLWDNGNGMYAIDEKFQMADQVDTMTSDMRIMKNTIKNMADYEGEIMNKLADLLRRKGVTIGEIEEAVGKIKLPEVKVKFDDAVNQINDVISTQIKATLEELKVIKEKIPNIKGLVQTLSRIKYNDYIKALNNLGNKLVEISNVISKYNEVAMMTMSEKKELEQLQDKIKEANNNLRNQTLSMQDNINALLELTKNLLVIMRFNNQPATPNLPMWLLKKR